MVFPRRVPFPDQKKSQESKLPMAASTYGRICQQKGLLRRLLPELRVTKVTLIIQSEAKKLI